VQTALMIDKFTADIKRTKTSICCLIDVLLQYWIDYWIVKQWRSTRVKINKMKLVAGFIFDFEFHCKLFIKK